MEEVGVLSEKRGRLCLCEFLDQQADSMSGCCVDGKSPDLEAFGCFLAVLEEVRVRVGVGVGVGG